MNSVYLRNSLSRFCIVTSRNLSFCPRGGGEGLVPGGLPGPGGAWSRGVWCVGVAGGDPPTATAAGRYASYWNALLLVIRT